MARLAEHRHREHQSTAAGRRQPAGEVGRHLHSQSGVPHGPRADLSGTLPAHSHAVSCYVANSKFQ